MPLAWLSALTDKLRRPSPRALDARDQRILAQTQSLLAGRGLPLTAMTDAELQRFNRSLPWAAMTFDARGRLVGLPHSRTKRARVHDLIDSRQAKFDRTFPLQGCSVLELGCFEGIHTLGLMLLGARVTAADGRIENVLKTQARLWAYGLSCPVLLWDVEKPLADAMPTGWDVLHHIGLLYHLSNPVEHLEQVLPRTRRAVLLDTHVAEEDAAPQSYRVDGRDYRYRRKPEAKAALSPFAGLRDHAKYLLPADIIAILERHGFSDRRLVSERNERNGRRITLWAFRDDGQDSTRHAPAGRAAGIPSGPG